MNLITIKQWGINVLDWLATAKAGLSTGGLTALWGWFTDVTIVGLVGIFSVLFTSWLAWKKHKREQEVHQMRIRRRKATCGE